MLKLLSILFLSISLSACATRDKLDPNTLPKVVEKQPVAKRLWAEQALSGPGQLQLNLVPAADPFFVYVADYHGAVEAKEIETNRIVWKTQLKAPLSVGPVLHGTLLLVGTQDGHLIALDARHGKQLWTAALPTTVLAKPAVDKHAVYVQTADSQVMAFDRQAGSRLWISEQSQPALILRGGSAPVVTDTALFVGTYDGKLLALSKETGALLWDKTIALPKGRTEVERMVDIVADLKQSDDDIFVATYQGKIACVNSRTSTLEWHRDFSVVQNFSVDTRAVYLTDTSGLVTALDKRTGATLWQQERLRARKPTGPQVIGHWVVVGDAAGYLYWLQTSDGRLRAIDDAGQTLATQPVLAEDIVIAYGTKGRWVAFKPQR